MISKRISTTDFLILRSQAVQKHKFHFRDKNTGANFLFKIDGKIIRLTSSSTRHQIELCGRPKSNTFWGLAQTKPLESLHQNEKVCWLRAYPSNCHVLTMLMSDFYFERIIFPSIDFLAKYWMYLTKFHLLYVSIRNGNDHHSLRISLRQLST